MLEHTTQLATGLGLVIATILLLSWLLRRINPSQFSQNGILQAKATLSLGLKEKIVLVEAGDTQLLVGVTGHSIQALHVFETPISTEAEALKPMGKQTFAKLLNRSLSG